MRCAKSRTSVLERILEWLEGRGSSRVLDKVSDDGEPLPYMVRYYLLRTPLISVYLHRFLADDRAELHDHPWWNMSCVMKGCYVEVTTEGRREIRPFRPVFRRADELHRIEVPPPLRGQTTSLFVTGPRTRSWTFEDGSVPHTEHDLTGWLLPVVLPVAAGRD